VLGKLFVLKPRGANPSIASRKIRQQRRIFRPNPRFVIRIDGIRRVEIAIRPMRMVEPLKIQPHWGIGKRIRTLIAMSPPLIITREEIDHLFAAVRRGLDRLWD